MKTQKNTKNATADEATGYKNLVDLMAIYNESSTRMDELENDLQMAWLDLVDARRNDYAELQEAVAGSSAAIETLATLNRQWFADSKTLKTPYGSVSFRTATKLEVKNEEVTILLIEQMGEDAAIFLRLKKELNLEAMEHLDDADLKDMRVRRVTTESCTVKAARVDLGKAVKAAAQAAGKGGAS